MNDEAIAREGVSVQLPSGQATSLRWDDVEHLGGVVPDTPRLITDERLNQAVHEMPEQWLRARVRGWMELSESPNLDYWIGTYTAEGKWISCSSRDNAFAPLQHRIDYARRLCRHVNKACAHGGVWLVGWIRGGHEFYLLWKDQDGDLRCPIECDRPFTALVGWSFYNWEQHCNGAIEMVLEHDRYLELKAGQSKKLAQGERVSANHLNEAPPIAL